MEWFYIYYLSEILQDDRKYSNYRNKDGDLGKLLSDTNSVTIDEKELSNFIKVNDMINNGTVLELTYVTGLRTFVISGDRFAQTNSKIYLLEITTNVDSFLNNIE